MISTNTPHLILAEDEPDAAEAVADFLTRKGYRVSVASDGMAALERHREDPADLVITDIRMPRLGGVELIRELRSDTPGLPVVVMTGHVEFEESAELQDGPLVTLRKPIRLGELVAEVARLLEDVGL